MSTDNINKLSVVDINITSENTSDIMDKTKSSAEFIMDLLPETLSNLRIRFSD